VRQCRRVAAITSIVATVALPGTWGERLQEVLQVGKVTSSDATLRMLGGYYPSFFHCPSETTSTEPSTTVMAVCSSMA
jgi:hypothetical protein